MLRFNHMLNAKGISFVEVLMSLAIVSASSYVLLNYNQFYGSQDYNMLRACEAHAAHVIGAVQQESYYRAIGVFLPGGGVRSPNQSIFNATTAASPADYWQGDVTDTISSGAGLTPPMTSAVNNNNLLIQGSVRTLAALYNKNPNLRCSAQGAAYPRLTGLQMSTMLSSLQPAPTVTLSLEPYMVDTQATLCGVTPPSAIFPAPRSFTGIAASTEYSAFRVNAGVYPNTQMPYSHVDPADTAARMSPPASASPIVRREFGPGTPVVQTDVGIAMTVRVNYQFKGQPYSCSATQKFEYPQDRTPPPTPNYARVVLNTSIKNPAGATVLRDYCADSITDPRASAEIEVGYQNVRPEAGVQLFCKDLSFERRVGNGSTTLGCRNGTTPLGGVAQPLSPSNSTFRDSGYPYNYTARFTLRQQPWQPCDLVGQCGVSPTSSTSTTASPTNWRVRMHYDNLPPGCVMNLEVVAVDTAGNRSGTRSAAASKKFLDQAPNFTSTAFVASNLNFTARSNEIYYPTCGRLDDPTYYRSGLGYYCWKGPAPGYYRCGTGTNGWC